MLDSEASSYNASGENHCLSFCNRVIDKPNFEENGKRMSFASTDSGCPRSLASLEERERIDLSTPTAAERVCYLVALSQDLMDAINLSKKVREDSEAVDSKKSADVREKCTDHSTQQAASKADYGNSVDDEQLSKVLHRICDDIEKFVFEKKHCYV